MKIELAFSKTFEWLLFCFDEKRNEYTRFLMNKDSTQVWGVSCDRGFKYIIEQTPTQMAVNILKVFGEDISKVKKFKIKMKRNSK